MFKNQCVISGDEPEAEVQFEINTVSGPLEYSRSFENRDDAEEHAEFVADLLPLRNVVSGEDIQRAKDIITLYVTPSTHDQGEAKLEEVISGEEVSDSDRDTSYAVRRIAIGNWFRRKMKKSTKNKKIAKMDPRKIQSLAVLCELPPEDAQGFVRHPETGEPAPLEDVIRLQENARTAIEQLQETAPSTFIPDDADPDEEMELLQNIPDQEEEVGWMPGADLYHQGANDDAGQDDWEVGNFFKKLIKAVSKPLEKLDPTKKGSLTGGLISAIPGIGPGVMAAANTLAQVRAGVKGAANKVKAVKELAQAGIPGAQDALKNLKTAQALDKKIQGVIEADVNPPKKTWFPFSLAWIKGAKSSV